MGLCPECLIKAGFPTGVETDTGSAKQPAFVPPTVEEIAKLFPQLEILGLVGRGGMGAVYKARQKQLNRFVALKILPPGIGGEPAFAERFTREAQALAQLNHPGIVTLYEFGETSGQFYFLMEFVDGVNLRQLLAGSRVSSREALAIVPQICDALQFAHDQGIVHRDIKPENILLDRRGRVKVADFGLAKIIENRDDVTKFSASENIPGNLTDAGKTMGTPNYMSPEQKENPGEVDNRADIYALGVVFYQMLTGELPGKKIAPPSTKVQIDVRLDEIVLRALEKNPEHRYQQVSEVKTCVETIAVTPDSSRPSLAMLKSERARLAVQEAPRANVKYPAMGEVALYADRLVISSGYDQRSIPLTDIRGLGEAVMPFWFSPGAHRYASVAFDEAGQRRHLVFLAGSSVFRSPGDTRLHAAEWLMAIQQVVKSASGREVPITQVPTVVPVKTWWTLLWLAVSLVAFLPLLAKFLLMPQRGPAWASLLDAGFLSGAFLLVPALALFVVYVVRSISLRHTKLKPIGGDGSGTDVPPVEPRCSPTDNVGTAMSGPALGQAIRARMNPVEKAKFEKIKIICLLATFVPPMILALSALWFDASSGLAVLIKDVVGALWGPAIVVALCLNTKFLASTEWAKQQGIRHAQLWFFSFKRGKRESEMGANVLPHFSRTAIVGACGVGVTLLAVLLWMVVYGQPAKTWMAMSQVEKVGFVVADSIVLAACFAPFITTILGWIAVSQIRRSAGKIYGLWLAVFDGLFFPLLVLDFVIYLVASHLQGVWIMAMRNSETNSASEEDLVRPILAIVVFFICALVDWLIIRRVWRAVNQPVEGSATLMATAPAEKSKSGQTALAVCALCFAGLSGVMGTMAFCIMPESSRVLDLAIPLAALLGISLGILTRKILLGKTAMIVGSINLLICLFVQAATVHSSSSQPASPSSVEFHYRVFEADAALVDKLIPPASRFTVSAPSDEFTISLGGVGYADAQAAKISRETLDSLLAGLSENHGMLEEQSRGVGSDWWRPGLADSWNYSCSDLNGLTGSGDGRGFLGFGHFHGTDEIRVAYYVDHSLDLSGHDSVNVHSKLFYQGDIPASHTLAFLAPFSRSDHSAHYLVVVFEIGNSKEQTEPAATAQNISFGRVMQFTLPMDKDGMTPLFDLDQDQPVFDPNPNDTAAGMAQLLKPGVVIRHDEPEHKIVLLGMSGTVVYWAHAPLGDQWENLTDMNALATVRRNTTSPGVIQGIDWPDTLPLTVFFKTGAGSLGILQITGLTENPSGVKIRYKLVQNSTASPAPTPIPAAAQNLSFGPVMERTIERGSSPHRALNLATGEFMSPSREREFVFRPDGADTLRVAGVDVYSSYDARAADNLNSLDMRYIAGLYPQKGDKAISIDDINAEEFSELLAKGQYFQTTLEKTGMFGGYRFDLSKVEPVLRGTNVYLFITRDGAQGLLQISGVTENPSGVKIRYKLVRQTPAPGGVYDKIWLNPNSSIYDDLDKAPPTLIVRPTHFPSSPSGGVSMSNGKAVYVNESLPSLLGIAGGKATWQMVLPGGLPEGHFDYMATLPAGQNGPALREEIERQFGLIAERAEPHETDVYLLKIKDPVKLRAQLTKGGESYRGEFGVDPMNTTFQNEPLSDPEGRESQANIRRELETYLKKPVLDKTGSTDKYDLKLVLSRALYLDIGDQNAKLAAIQDQLAAYGLELSSARATIEMLVVEKVQNAISNLPPESVAAPTVEADLKFLEVPAGLPLDLNKFDLVVVEKQPGVNLLSAPRVTTSSGRECEIEVVRGATKDAFTPTPTGVTARLRPTLAGDTVHYEVKFTISTHPAPGAAARTTIQEFTRSGDAPLDKPVVFEVGTAENGKRSLAWMVFRRVENTPPVHASSAALTGTSQIEIRSPTGELKPGAPVDVRLLLDKAKIDFPPTQAPSPSNAVIAWGKPVNGLTVGFSCETTHSDSRKLPKIYFYVANAGDTEIPGIIQSCSECILTVNGQHYAQRSWGGKSSAMPPGRKYGPIAIATDEFRQIPELRAWPVPDIDLTAPRPELREGTNTLRVDYIRDHMLVASGEIQIVAK